MEASILTLAQRIIDRLGIEGDAETEVAALTLIDGYATEDAEQRKWLHWFCGHATRSLEAEDPETAEIERKNAVYCAGHVGVPIAE